MGCRTLEDLENVSEAQVDEKIIPAITDLDVPLVISSRLKKLIKAIREAAKVSWDRKRKGTVEDEDVPLPSDELKRSGSLFFSRYKLRFSADEDAGETVVSRLKRQLNKHCIRFENILKTKTRKGETAETRVKRTKLGDETELIVREEPERKQPKTIAAEAYLDALWTYILGLARAGVEELQDKPSAAETDGSQTYDYVQIPLDVTVNSHARAKRFTASLPRALLPLQREELNRRLQPLQKQMKMSAVPHPHYLVDISVALVITIMYLTKWQDNMLPTRLFQGHNLMNTIAGVPGRPQEENPLLTREDLLDRDHRQNLIVGVRQAKMDEHADFLSQSCLEKQGRSGPRRCCRRRKSMRRSSMVGANASLQHRAGVGQLWRTDDARGA